MNNLTPQDMQTLSAWEAQRAFDRADTEDREEANEDTGEGGECKSTNDYNRSARIKRRLENREFVAFIRANTVCANCGRQPIDWHNEAHIKFPKHRVSNLAGSNCSIERIKTEINKCVALCRSCHMKVDGRMKNMIPGGKKEMSTLPCSQCGRKYFPLRKQLCSPCYAKKLRLSAKLKQSLIANKPSECEESKNLRCERCYEYTPSNFGNEDELLCEDCGEPIDPRDVADRMGGNHS